MDSLLQDLRYGARMLWKAPGFTAVAVATLALGIGANAAIFGVANALLWRTPAPVREPDRLVMIYSDEGGGPEHSSMPDFHDLRERGDTLEGLAAYRAVDVDLSLDERAERVPGMLVTPGFFELLGLHPVRGRFFGAGEGAGPVLVLSHALWSQWFGASTAVVGRTVLLNGGEFTVVGVAPPGFRGPSVIDEAALFVPMDLQPRFMPGFGNLLENRARPGVLVVGRLAPHATVQAVRSNVEAIGAGLAERYPATNGGRAYRVVPYRRATLPPGIRGDIVRTTGLLASVTGLVLLAACVNVANLLLARSRRRRRELALRRAMGARRPRLVGQLLVESLLLAALGGGVAVLLAQWGADLIPRLPVPEHFRVAVDSQVLAFTAGLTALTGLLFGLTPAVRSTRLDVSRELRVERGGLDVAPRMALGSALVVGQVALSLILVVMAALFARTLWNLGTTDLGFEPRGLLVAEVDPSLQGYDAPRTELLYRRLLERLRKLPGVEGASVASALPASEARRVDLQVEGSEGGTPLRADVVMVADDYFPTLGIPLLRGRRQTTEDRAGAPVVMLNRTAARGVERISGRDALGGRIRIDAAGLPPLSVVGIVADSVTGALGAEPRPAVYVAHRVLPEVGLGARMQLVVRVEGVATRLTGEVRAILQQLDPELPLVAPTTMDRRLRAALATPRLAAVLTAGAAVLALVLAAGGLYGVLALSVSQRTAEMGIRRALGADAGTVLTMVIAQGLRLAGSGVALGLVASVAAGRLATGFLYGVGGADPASFVVAAGLLVAVAVLAAWVPARQATRIDPAVALRQE